MIKDVLKSYWHFCLLTHVSCLSSTYVADAFPSVEALTSSDEKVILHANGKWEFVNVQKAAATK